MRVRSLVAMFLGLLLGLTAGCGVFRARPVSLEAAVVNDGNRVLTVEGTSDLPDAAPITAELFDGERTLGRGRSLVRSGHFFLTLDVSQAPGNAPLALEVSFDPAGAPESILDEVGPEGRRMVGDTIEEEGGRLRAVERLRVILPMSRRDAGVRKVQAGDLAAGIAILETVVQQSPEDWEAAAWLALASLQRNPAERKPGSRAHEMLAAATGHGLPEPALSQARDWLDRLDREASLAARREAREGAAREEAARKERQRSEIVPGRALGGVAIGMEPRAVFAEYMPERFPAYAGLTETVRLPKLDVEVDLDGTTHLVTRVATASERFRLPGDLGVGSPLLAFQERFPGGTLNFEPAQRGADGVRRAKGEYVLPEGMVLEVERTFDEIGLPVDEVVGLAVVAPQAVPSSAVPSGLPEIPAGEAARPADPSAAPGRSLSKP